MRIILITLVFLSLFINAQAQVSSQDLSDTLYQSTVDELMSIQKISVLPTLDNISGIYARPVETHLNQFIDQNHHWDLITPSTVGQLYSPEDLVEDPKLIQQMNIPADAVISSKVTKGPGGITIRVALFLTRDGKLFAQDSVKNFSQFDVDKIKEQAEILTHRVLKKIPYDALVLSRQGTRVTLNLGKNDGVKKNQILSAVQIFKVKRHPRFHFFIGADKEILGKIKILKVDQTLSFGQIITEIEKGAIQKGAKITGLHIQDYSKQAAVLNQGNESDLASRPDAQLSFGKNAKAWVPKKPPTFGQVSARVGLGSYSGSLTQPTPLEATSAVYPSIYLNGEIWVNPTLSIHTNIRQGIIQVSNPVSGSSLSNLSLALSSYDLSLGYGYRTGPDAYGARFDFLAGFGNYQINVDDVTNGLTSMSYSGLKLGLKGYFPITYDRKWAAGTELYMYLNPNMTETPGTSGANTKNTVNQFSFFARYQLSASMFVLGSLDIELYSTQFSGSGTRTQASSASHRHTSLSSGLLYMF